ncbi:TPA: diphthine--ammonia ligase [Candidatus Bathyarchaeota archaeon]|nr:diphthine--ammonia ligase [Candidatus Bathyarchaeota archaeon]
MKLGVLFSGGKDSTFALHMASEREEIACLIAMLSKNEESYMFHTPNIDITALQAEAMELPILQKTTVGRQDEELSDLKEAIAQAIREYKIEGVVSGAIESVYQSERIQRICSQLDVWCFNPLWKRDQREHLEELVAKGYDVIISGIFAYPLDETWLGKRFDRDLIGKLLSIRDRFGISPSGEGGEIETTVLDAPLFKKRIKILESEVEAKGNSGVLRLTEVRLVQK